MIHHMSRSSRRGLAGRNHCSNDALIAIVSHLVPHLRPPSSRLVVDCTWSFVCRSSVPCLYLNASARSQKVKKIGVQLSSDKAIIDRRFRPLCCHLGSYFKRPKSSPVRPLACNWYYCAQLIAKPKAACVLRFSWATTSSSFGL